LCFQCSSSSSSHVCVLFVPLFSPAPFLFSSPFQSNSPPASHRGLSLAFIMPEKVLCLCFQQRRASWRQEIMGIVGIVAVIAGFSLLNRLHPCKT
jgi:hypothetical protein